MRLQLEYAYQQWPSPKGAAIQSQAVTVSGASKATRRVRMGSGYIIHSRFEVFEENTCEYPVLLPNVLW